MGAGWAAAVRMLRHVGGGVLDALLPQTCVACEVWLTSGRGIICRTCMSTLTSGLDRPYCWRCGRTLPAAALHEGGCARCRTESFWNLAGVARVGRYEKPVRLLVTGLKYHGRERNAEVLADWLAVALRKCRWAAELDGLVPVPVHWLRRAQRPCHHTRLLAEALSRRLRLPVLNAVRRVKHSPSQTTILTRAARFQNVSGCFAPAAWYTPRWSRPVVTGKTVCIVDNVIHSGATVTEVSKVLRRMGARRIYAAVVGRPSAPGDPPAGLPEDGPEDSGPLVSVGPDGGGVIY